MNITIDINALTAMCIKRDIAELALFGSILRDDFNKNSDIDILVTFNKNAKITLFDLVELREELAALFKREVDVIEKQSIVNPYRKRSILSNLEVLYAA